MPQRKAARAGVTWVGFFVLVAVASPGAAATAMPPRVEVVFVLDTTGSMDGLIGIAC